MARLAEMRLSPGVALDKLRRHVPLACYLSTFCLVTLFASMTLMTWSWLQGVGWLTLLLLLVPILISASQLGVGLANWLATQLLSPQSLPRLDFKDGIPPEQRTLVVVPTMLTSAAGVEHMLEG